MTFLSVADRKQITAQDIEYVLDLVEVYDLDTANLLRAYIRGLESLALSGELLNEEITEQRR